MATPEAFYSVRELAKAWLCSPNHIYDLIARGDLASTDIGIGRAMTRIPHSAVVAFGQKRGRVVATPDREARAA